MSVIPEFSEAIKRLSFQAEVGGWYKEDSTVPVRIGDLYSIFDKLRELENLVKYNEDTAWYNFNITQEIFNYLLTRGCVSDDLDGEDTWEAAAQNIIRSIETLENNK